MFNKSEEIKLEDLGNGVSRKILGYSKELMMVEVIFEAGAIGTIHTHPHLQTSYVAKGRFDVTIGDETMTLVEGDNFYVESDVPHGVKALDDGILVDIFNPYREDFVE